MPCSGLIAPELHPSDFEPSSAQNEEYTSGTFTRIADPAVKFVFTHLPVGGPIRGIMRRPTPGLLANHPGRSIPVVGQSSFRRWWEAGKLVAVEGV